MIPAALRRRFRIEKGSLLMAEAVAEGVLIPPAVIIPLQIYTPERNVRLFKNITNAGDYARAGRVGCGELGLDPDLKVRSRPRAIGVDQSLSDANALLLAAYRRDARVRRRRGLTGVQMVASVCAVDEAKRNLSAPEQRAGLNELLSTAPVSNLPVDVAVHSEITDSGLPEKDMPILPAAVAARSSNLEVGNRRLVGHSCCHRSAGVLVLRGAEYLSGRGPSRRTGPG